MIAIPIFLTLLLLFAVLAAGAWGGFLAHGRLAFLEAECRRLRLAAVEDGQQFERWHSELTSRLEAAEQRAADAQQRPFQSVNYSQRSQMLRMIRRGDAAPQIANTLGVPLSQVRLLMKLPGVNLASSKENLHPMISMACEQMSIASLAKRKNLANSSGV